VAAFVIIGGGLAGAKAAEALRDQGYDGELVLIAEEPHRPYERPPLSKGYLAGSSERDEVFVHPEDWYAEHNVDLRLGVAATAINRDQHTVELADGERVEYDKLLLATGSSPRRLPVPGGDTALYLRTLDDSEAIKSATTGEGKKIVIIGAGWIGLEVAAAARQSGAEVTIVEVAELPLLRVLGREIAEVFAELHRQQGVDLRFKAQVERIEADAVTLADGTRLDADTVVVGVGIAPNVKLAQDAGLEVDNGVVVNASLRTSDPDVFAAGDVANALRPPLGRHVRVEHWANALNQPATAAAAMLGKDATYDELPYFYTDQYDLGMEYSGYVEPDDYDRVVIRGDTATREFIAFWLRDNRVLAGMNVNVWDVQDQIQALVRAGYADRPIDPDRLADQATPLENLL
jgi:3-phenylpropionate/trans-cinnamate dioxygenase ferredoxin reductase component